MTYDEIKKKLEPYQRPALLGACFVLVFLLGFGTGRIQQPPVVPKSVSSYPNYSTKPAGTTPAQVKGAATTSPATAAADQSCVIKGNISSAGKKIYHIPGGAFYKTVKPEQCFKTEAEAAAAGFVKSSR